MFQIYIPTKGRINNQLTISNLPLQLQQQTTIVCPSKEASRHSSYHKECKVVIQPDDNMGIALKRQWIIETTPYDKIVMLDDDLRFAIRRIDEPAKFRKAEPVDIITAFLELEELLSIDVPHAGFSARGGGIGKSAQKGGWQIGKRMMYVLGYYVPTVKTHATFGRLTTHEDMDVCLQLLTQGFPNMVNFSFVVDQKFGNPGGCTNERTVEGNNIDVIKLAEFFPRFVSIRQKDYIGSTPRMEVTVQWLQAFKYGCSFSLGLEGDNNG